MAKDTQSSTATQSAPATQSVAESGQFSPSQRAPKAVEFEGLEHEVRAPKQAQPKVEQPTYTRCFLIQHSAFGSVRVFHEDEAAAVQHYIDKKCPGVKPAEFRTQASVTELIHRPAATEAHKPHGWTKPKGRIALPM